MDTPAPVTVPSPAISFAKACLDFFGRKPNQSMSEFSKEIGALNLKDRADFRAEFARIGVNVVADAAPKTSS